MGNEMYYQISCSGVAAGYQSTWGNAGGSGCEGPPSSVVPLQVCTVT
jgi:hypothetical protein